VVQFLYSTAGARWITSPLRRMEEAEARRTDCTIAWCRSRSWIMRTRNMIAIKYAVLGLYAAEAGFAIVRHCVAQELIKERSMKPSPTAPIDTRKPRCRRTWRRSPIGSPKALTITGAQRLRDGWTYGPAATTPPNASVPDSIRDLPESEKQYDARPR